jgi:hypothetical protein
MSSSNRYDNRSTGSVTRIDWSSYAYSLPTEPRRPREENGQ